jgi:hypothetical protein
MAGLGLFPAGGMALVYTALVILGIAFIWLLFERPKAALDIVDGLARALFYVVKGIAIAVWRVMEWIGGMIARLWK